MPASSIVLFSQTRLQIRFSVKSWRSSLRAHFNSGPSLFWGNHGQPHEIITTPDRNLPETPPPPHLTITLTLSLTLSPLMRGVLRGGIIDRDLSGHPLYGVVGRFDEKLGNA